MPFRRMDFTTLADYSTRGKKSNRLLQRSRRHNKPSFGFQKESFSLVGSQSRFSPSKQDDWIRAVNCLMNWDAFTSHAVDCYGQEQTEPSVQDSLQSSRVPPMSIGNYGDLYLQFRVVETYDETRSIGRKRISLRDWETRVLCSEGSSVSFKARSSVKKSPLTCFLSLVVEHPVLPIHIFCSKFYGVSL